MMWRVLLLAALLHGAVADENSITKEEGAPVDDEYIALEEVEMITTDADDGPLDDADEEDIKHEEEIEALTYYPPKETPVAKGLLDADVMSHVHSVPIEEEEAMNGGYIFDVDNNNRNPTQRCYVRNQAQDINKMPDNIENSIINAQSQLNNDGTNRAQWAKCLPPPMYTLLSVESFAEGDIYNGRYEKRMRNATDFYATLKWLHNEACAHIRVRLENEVMLNDIREEVNYRAKKGMGFKIKQALDPIIKQIVHQYHSWNPKVNPANAKTYGLIKQSIGPMKQALRVAKHSSMYTLENGEGRRRNTCAPSAKEMMDPLYKSVIDFDMNEFEKFLTQRPEPLDDIMTGNGKNGLGEPVVGSDGLPDSLKNYGKCGKPLFDFAGYTLYTLTVSRNSKGDITFLTKKGWKTPEQIVADTMNLPLRALLPPDAYEVETKTTSYQDDLFASGNLACGDRADGLWTLTSYDRDSAENKVTATQEEGYFCVWMLNDLLVLPENQRAGFSNTEFIGESPQEMARVMNGDVENYKRYFPKPGEKYKYYHCHYSPRNSGSARVHSFQHQAERHYPGGIRQYCNCDWRRMGMIVSRCDCTLDAKANGGCRRVEMDMLNEHTQLDLWRKDGKKDFPSRVAMVHGSLAEGKIKSYTYQNNRRRRQPDNRNIYQEDTGRVRPTTNGNGGNNVVCSVDGNGNADNANVRNYQRQNENIYAYSSTDPNLDNCRETPGLRMDIYRGTGASTNLNQIQFNRGPNTRKVLAKPSGAGQLINYQNSASAGSSMGAGTNTQFAVRWWGAMQVKKANNYYFNLNCDDGCRFYIDNQQRINNDHHNYWRNYNSRIHLAVNKYNIRVEFFQNAGNSGIQFYVNDYNNRATVSDSDISFTAACSMGSDGNNNALKRSFFVDLNGDGKMSYTECRRRRTNNRRRREQASETCNGNGKEFTLRDIQARNQGSRDESNPAGGVNQEFIDENGEQCDILKLKHSCKPADAGNLRDLRLTNFLAKFCDVPAALYQVPVNASGVVDPEFGALTQPMPFRKYGEKWTNYRAQARADMASKGKGTWLFNGQCKPGARCEAGTAPLAVQGNFRGIEDERVWSEEGAVLRSKFYAQVGGRTTGTVSSSVPTKWTQAGTKSSGLFNNDVLQRYRVSKNAGTKYAKDRVHMDASRREGVTCLNGKYVYARTMPDGKRPVVSTVREALNRNGPVAQNGQWACRYVGVHCNANNCNNNGNGEVPGPFVEPLIKAKKEKAKPTRPPTEAPAPTTGPKPTEPPTEAPTTRRRRRGSPRRRSQDSTRRRSKKSTRRRSPRRRATSEAKGAKGTGGAARRRRRRAKN